MENTHSCGRSGVHLEPLLNFFMGIPEKNLGPVTKDVVKYLKSASQLNLIGFVNCLLSIHMITNTTYTAHVFMEMF